MIWESKPGPPPPSHHTTTYIYIEGKKWHVSGLILMTFIQFLDRICIHQRCRCLLKHVDAHSHNSLSHIGASLHYARHEESMQTLDKGRLNPGPSYCEVSAIHQATTLPLTHIDLRKDRERQTSMWHPSVSFWHTVLRSPVGWYARTSNMCTDGSDSGSLTQVLHAVRQQCCPVINHASPYT